jgi:hypothetical protein
MDRNRHRPLTTAELEEESRRILEESSDESFQEESDESEGEEIEDGENRNGNDGKRQNEVADQDHLCPFDSQSDVGDSEHVEGSSDEYGQTTDDQRNYYIGKDKRSKWSKKISLPTRST